MGTELNNRLDDNHFLVPIKTDGDRMYMWYSICSSHRSHDRDCPRCKTGSWIQIFNDPNLYDEDLQQGFVSEELVKDWKRKCGVVRVDGDPKKGG